MKKQAAILTLAALLLTGSYATVTTTGTNSATPETGFIKQLKEKFRTFYTKAGEERIYLQTDKSFYKPGETVWFSAHLREAATLKASPHSDIIHVEFITPKGATEKHYKLVAQNGIAKGDFDLTAHPSGIYKIRAYTEWQKNDDSTLLFEKEITVQHVVMPRLKMKMDFEKKAYGPGDEVLAKLELNTNENKALGSTPVKYSAKIEGTAIVEGTAISDASGKAAIRFRLPKELKTPDGLLQVLIDFEGATESISRSIPIVLNRIGLDFFPEGGDLVQGILSRVAFLARNEFGKPADVAGVVIDSKGSVVARFESFHAGMGTFEFTPQPGEKYRARITKPDGIGETYLVPEASKAGYVMTATPSPKSVQLTIHSWRAEPLSLVAQTRGRIYYAQEFNALAGANTITINTNDFPIGISQITLFDKNGVARSERLVFVNKSKQLNISLQTDKQEYRPREKVTMEVKVTDGNGLPVAGNFSLSVADDNLLAFADDKQGNILSKMLLEPELKEKVEEPNFYFDTKEPKADRALDFLMMTSGWRRYTWKQINNSELPAHKYAVEKAELSGMVFDAYTGKPVPGASLIFKLSGRNTKTDKDGKYSFRGIDLSAENELLISAPNYRTSTQQIDDYGRDKNFYLSNNRDFRRWEMMPMAAEMGAPRGGVKNKVVEEAVQEEMFFVDGVKVMQVPDLIEKPKDADKKEPVAEEKDIIQGAIVDMRMEDIMAFEKKIAAPENRILYYRAKEFPRKQYAKEDSTRNDFATTVYWNGQLETDRTGRARVEFVTNDLISSFRAIIEGFGDDGSIGRGEQSFATNLPFNMDAKIPAELISGDKLMIPVFLKNNTKEIITGQMTAKAPKQIELANPTAEVLLSPGSVKVIYLECRAASETGEGKLEISFQSPTYTDRLTRDVKVTAKGFPVAISLSGQELQKDFTIQPLEVVPGSMKVTFTAYPNILAELMSGVESILREPHGCFEQASSSTYPNIMVLNYLKTMQVKDAALEAKATKLLDEGYKKLVAFETKENGYEWFGAAPAHEALTAYGLMEFTDMKKVYGGVDQQMIDRTVKLLLDKRDGSGGFIKNPKALDSFGAADEDVTNAYIVYALSEAGYKELQKELDGVVKSARKTNDPYIMALCVNALFNTGDKTRGEEMLARLVKTRNDAGFWTGAKHSITRSTGLSLHVETTSLALLALMKSQNPDIAALTGGVKYLVGARSGFGGFGSTQATILALKALTRYAEFSKQTDEAGAVEIWVNGVAVASKKYAKGERDNITIAGLEPFIKSGKQKVEIKFKESQKALPYSMNISYHTLLPQSAGDAAIGLKTSLSASQTKVGETVRLSVTITNRTNTGQPMTLALIGIPAGLSPQPWQLKELQDKGILDYYELIGNNVACYYRALAPGAQKQINFDLKAEVPGEFEAPASSAYLYYTAEKKDWKKSERILIHP